MSIFQTEADQPAGGAPALNDLVGEGKKFKTVEDLAKGKVESDRFVDKLQNEMKELREELTRRVTVEEAIRKAQEAGVTVDPPKPSASGPAPTQAQPADIDRKISEALEQRDRARTTESNLTEVNNKLVTIFGTPEKARDTIKSRASELGMSVADLQAMAASNPKAFYKLIGLEDKPTNGPQTSSWSKVKNPSAMTANSSGVATQPGTYRYYQELRKSDPAAYFSPRVQLQMDQDARKAQAEGRDFYS